MSEPAQIRNTPGQDDSQVTNLRMVVPDPPHWPSVVLDGPADTADDPAVPLISYNDTTGVYTVYVGGKVLIQCTHAQLAVDNVLENGYTKYIGLIEGRRSTSISHEMVREMRGHLNIALTAIRAGDIESAQSRLDRALEEASIFLHSVGVRMERVDVGGLDIDDLLREPE